MVSGQLLARVPKGAVGVKGAVTVNGMERRRSDPVGTADLQLTAGWRRKRAKFGHKSRGGMCMSWAEGIHEQLIVQAIPWEVCILPSSLVEQAVVHNARLRCVLPDKHCHEGLILHQG